MVEEMLEKLDKVWNYSMDINSVLMRNMPEITAAAIEEKFFNLFVEKINVDRQDYEIIDAVCMVDDCMEFGPQALFDKIAVHALPKFAEILYAKGKN